MKDDLETPLSKQGRKYTQMVIQHTHTWKLSHDNHIRSENYDSKTEQGVGDMVKMAGGCKNLISVKQPK